MIFFNYVLGILGRQKLLSLIKMNSTVIKGLYTVIRNEYCNELYKPLTIIGLLLLSGYILFKCFEVIRSRYSYSFPSFRKSLLPSAEDIHHRLDKLNEESEIQPFFARTFHVEDNYRGLFGIDLADKAQCDRQYIYDTGIIASNTLVLPYNGVNIDGIVEDIITASELSPSAPRSKYLLATLRGVGGGKTRMIEETRIRIGILYPNWLPIAITFNHKSPIDDCDYKLKYPDAIVAYAVCCRMLVAVYNIPMIEARKRMDVALKLSESIEADSNMQFLAENLIVGTVQHIAERVKKVKPAVDSLVLFIDESAKLIEDENFPITGVNNDRCYAYLRQTILGESVGRLLKTSLMMTSLSVSVFGKTESDRIIKPVVLAAKLPVDHIVDNIWIPSFNVSPALLDATEKSMLKWLAASVSAAPRLVELMGDALKSKFAKTWSANSQGLTLRKSMGAVLSAFNGTRKSYYKNMQFPEGKYLHALIYADIIVVDDTTLQYVRSSSFTNSLTEFPEKNGADQFLVPESALCLLASTTVVKSDVIAREIQNEFKAIWNNLLNHIESPLSSALGQPLEDVFTKVLRMRILSTHLKEVNPGQTNLKDLLAIDMSAIKYTIGGKPYNPAKISKAGKSVVQDSVNKKLDKWEAVTFDRAGPVVKSRAKEVLLSNLLSCEILVPKVVRLEEIWSSIENITDWKESIKAIDSSLELDKPQPNNDHCDLMLFAKMVLSSWWQTKISGDEIVIVFEEKSRGEDNDSNRIWWGHFIQQGKAGKEKGPYDQYEKFCQVVASITVSDLEGDRGYLRALMEGRFIYVYVTTHAGPTVYLAAQDLPHIQSNSLGVLVLNREVTQRILGVTFDVYALTRSVMM